MAATAAASKPTRIALSSEQTSSTMLEKNGCQTLKKLGTSPTIIQTANFHSTARNDVSEKDGRLSKEEILNMRQQVIGPCTTVFYKSDPLLVARASGQYLYDEHGNRHLDCISNVQHVGHCHPAVVEAVTKQMSMTNCNSRFVHENIVLCGQRLLATLPPQLDRIFFVNSGSEANDLALRIARDFTGGHDIVVIDHAYHGHLTSTIDMSPYKFNGKGGRGKPDHTHVAPCPDVYRGKHRLPENLLDDSKALAEAGHTYAEDVRILIEEAAKQGRPKIAAFYLESLQSCGGQVIPPPDYLRNVIKHVHAAGGVVVADEVQTGFGRVGEKFWAYQLQGDDVIPDIVTMGKPMGNGFPVSAVACRRELAEAFGNGMEYFNTFGGNPVSCAAALAVMDVMEKEKLQENAREVGQYMLARLKELRKKYPKLVGDIRGIGLFAGIDLVTDTEKRTPATEMAKRILMSMRRKRVCLSTEGPYNNIIKIKPPICFSKADVDEMVEKLDETIREEISGPNTDEKLTSKDAGRKRQDDSNNNQVVAGKRKKA